jgi:hypothetical protein
MVGIQMKCRLMLELGLMSCLRASLSLGLNLEYMFSLCVRLGLRS